MAKRLLCLLLAGLFLTLPILAGASNFYLFPDSNRRLLTYTEVDQWQRDALSYAFNELFARYGRPFIPGERFYNYFNCQTWYREDPNYPGDGPVLSNLEWKNYTLIKQVIADKKASGNLKQGKALPEVFDDRINGLLSGFEEVFFGPNQQLKVYDGPGTNYRRGADGKAVASTNGRVYAAGWESGWLMVMYELNKGGVRVGFASPNDFRENPSLPFLQFQPTQAFTLKAAQLTDDPVMALTPIARLPQGAEVTWLSRFYGPSRSWDYVEVVVDGQLMRGFLPSGTVDSSFIPAE
jgi:hypothetical protein